MLRFPFHTLILLMVGGFLLSACDNIDQEGDQVSSSNGQEATRVEVLEVTPTYFEDIIEFNGSVEAIDDARISAQVAGSIVQMADRGQFVQSGQIVAQLDPSEARASVNQAKAQVETARSQSELAQDNFDRQEPLYRDTVISAREFEAVRAELNQARSSLRQAEAQLEQARDQLERTRIRAPFSGTVEERMVREGEQINSGEQVARIVNTSRVIVSAGVPERYADDVSEGTRVQIRLRQDGTFSRDGRISFVGRAIDPQSRTFPIEVELPNPEGRLKPEMVARVFLTRTEIEDALVVPRPAILRDEDGANLYVANRSGQQYVAERRSVTLGSEYGNRTVITAGLQPGDLVVVQGQTNISQSDRLLIEDQHEDAETVDLPSSDESDLTDEDLLETPESTEQPN